jgi:hypothetical protein
MMKEGYEHPTEKESTKLPTFPMSNMKIIQSPAQQGSLCHTSLTAENRFCGKVLKFDTANL